MYNDDSYLYHPKVQVPKCASTTVEGIIKKLSKRNNFTFHRSTNYWRFLSNSCSWPYSYHPALHKSNIVLRIWVLTFFNRHIKILRTVYLFQPGVAAQRGEAACQELGQDGERGIDHLWSTLFHSGRREFEIWPENQFAIFLHFNLHFFHREIFCWKNIWEIKYFLTRFLILSPNININISIDICKNIINKRTIASSLAKSPIIITSKRVRRVIGWLLSSGSDPT